MKASTTPVKVITYVLVVVAQRMAPMTAMTTAATQGDLNFGWTLASQVLMGSGQTLSRPEPKTMRLMSTTMARQELKMATNTSRLTTVFIVSLPRRRQDVLHGRLGAHEVRAGTAPPGWRP